jgi:uncharacterized protein YlxP (DUF503 family)
MIGSVVLELRLPASNSLKDKRSVLRRFMEHLRREYGVAVAEIGAQDDRRAAIIEVAAVSNQRAHLHKILTKVVDDADRPGDMILTRSEIQV